MLNVRLSGMSAVGGLLALLALSSAPAHAQFTMTLNSPDQVGTPGETLTYFASVKNNSGGVNIDSTTEDITNQVGNSFSLANFTDVFGPAHPPPAPNNFIGYIPPATPQQMELFTITIPTTTAGGDKAFGNYYVNYTFSLDTLVIPYSVTVASVPEPGALALVADFGVTGIGILARRRRAR